MVPKHKYLPEPIITHNETSNVFDEYEIYEINKDTPFWFSILNFYYRQNKTVSRVPLLVRIIISHNIIKNNYTLWVNSIKNNKSIYLIRRYPYWVFVNLDNINSTNMSYRESFKEELNIIFKKHKKPTIK